MLGPELIDMRAVGFPSLQALLLLVSLHSAHYA